MTPTNYQRGRAFEYRARDALKKRGATFVMRAAQSKGAADLLALWPMRKRSGYGNDNSRHGCTSTQPWLVQCKYSVHGGGYLPSKDAVELVALAERTGALPVFARPGKNGRGVEFINLYSKEPIG
jgi:Holliday junction resolvase